MYVRLYKRDKYYYVAYKVGDRWQRRSLGITDKRTAELKRAEIEKKLALGVDPLERVSNGMLLSEFFEKYLVHCKTANTETTYHDKVKRTSLILRLYGDRELSAITKESLDDYRVLRRRTATPSTVNRDMTIIKHALNCAVEWGYLETNPAQRIRKFKENPSRTRYLTEEEYRRLLSACDDELKRVIIAAVHTGLRKGELVKLKLSDIDYDKKQLTVRNSKTNESRVIPLNDDAIKAFRPGLLYLVNFRNRFEKAVKDAEIDDFTFHDLRHTFASWLVMAGVDLAAVKQLMGHKTFQMTLRYAHLAPDYLQDAVAQITHN